MAKHKVVIVHTGEDLLAYASGDTDVYIVDLTWEERDGIVLNEGKPLPIESLAQMLTDYGADLEPAARKQLAKALKL